MPDVIGAALLESVTLPFITALAVALVAWRAGVARAGLAVAAGVIAGTLAGEVAVAGWPALPPQGAIGKLPWLALPPQGAIGKLPWLALGGAGLGVVVAGLNDERLRVVASALGAGAAILWLGWPRLGVPDPLAWLATGLLWVGASVALSRLQRAGSVGGALLLVIGAFAAAGVAFYGSSYRMAQLVTVLAAAIAGAMAGAGAAGPGLGAAGRLAAAMPLVGLVTILTLYTQADALAIVLLLPIFLAEGARRRFFGPRAAMPARLALLAALALLPACAAVAVALWRSGPLYF